MKGEPHYTSPHVPDLPEDHSCEVCGKNDGYKVHGNEEDALLMCEVCYGELTKGEN